jgi:hypothetical protein
MKTPTLACDRLAELETRVIIVGCRVLPRGRGQDYFRVISTRTAGLLGDRARTWKCDLSLCLCGWEGRWLKTCKKLLLFAGGCSAALFGLSSPRQHGF